MTKRRRYTQKALVKKLQDHGWTLSSGGKHQVKMVREGCRPITIPVFKNQTLPVGLSTSILKQAEIEEGN
jgi:predicted RNA binding protein YcfA (HicA-like mRNA interferase family)